MKARTGENALRNRPLCGLAEFDQLRYTAIPRKSATRRWEEDLEGVNTTLGRLLLPRTMSLPKGSSAEDMNTFLIEEGQKDGIYDTVWEAQRNGVRRGINTAVTQNLDKKAFGYEMSHLAGCTALLIVSRKGMYIGHYWENIGFNLDLEIHGDLYQNKEEAFEKSVIDALNGRPKYKAHPPLTSAKDQLDDESIKAFLIIPDTGDAGPGQEPPLDPYRNEWNRMKAEVGKIVPRLANTADQKHWQEVTYHPVQDEERQFRKNEDGTDFKDEFGLRECTYDPLHETYRGRMIAKFDPDHEGKKKLAIWFETKLIYDDNW